MRRFFYATGNEDDNSNDGYRPKLSTFPIGAIFSLTDSIVHHWCRVLRAVVGDQGILFDGFGGEYHVQLHAISKKQATVILLAYINIDRTTPIISKIALVMSRGERMDYAIQKSTELGVTAIQLLSSHHGEVFLKPTQVDKKLMHWQQVAIAACEQCGLNRPPLILAPLAVNDWLQNMATHIAEGDSINVHAEQQSTLSPIVATLSQDIYYQALNTESDLRLMLSVPAANQPSMPQLLQATLAQNRPYIELLIGPEGGLSADECRQAERVNFTPWQIGSRVLRTETAPVVALATLNALKYQ